MSSTEVSETIAALPGDATNIMLEEAGPADVPKAGQNQKKKNNKQGIPVDPTPTKNSENSSPRGEPTAVSTREAALDPTQTKDSEGSRPRADDLIIEDELRAFLTGRGPEIRRGRCR